MKPTLHTLKTSARGNVTLQTIMDPNNEVFFRKGQGLYAWMHASTYLSLSDEDFHSEKYPIKFGQYGADAKNGSTPQDTISGYVGTTIDAIVILWAVRFSDEQITNIGNSKFVEKKVGTIKNLGPKIEVGSSTEAFKTNLKLIINTVNETLYPQIQHGFFVTERATYQPRYRQQQCIDKFLQYYNKNKNSNSVDFLLAAVPRFGKNFTFLEMARSSIPKNGNILMLTGRPDVFSSLKDDITNHVNYTGWIYDELKDKMYEWQPSPNTVNVLAVSTQLLLNKKHKNHKKLINFLSQFTWDIRGLDEADTNMLSELSSEILNDLTAPVSVWITGTPWKVLSTGNFTERNIYSYDYVQQQKDKKARIDLRAVTIDWYIIEILDKIKEQKKWYTDEEGFTLRKLFAFNEETGRFIHEADVRTFLKAVFGIIPKNKFSPYKIIPELKHTFWVLPPNTEAVIRLKYLIEKITNEEIKVFAATGNEVDDITEIQDFLKWSGDKKTVVLSINRFTRGTTVPEWDATFFMNDTESAEYYFQAAFRCSSPAEGKDRGYVFDFNGNRTLVMIAEYARLAAQQRGITNPVEISREFLDNFNVFGTDGGVEFRKKDIMDLISATRTSNYTANTLRNSGSNYINLDSISETLIQKIMGMDKDVSKRLKIELSSAGKLMKKGKNYKSVPLVKNKKFEKGKKDLIARIATMMSRLPIICTLPEFNTVEDIIKYLPEDEFYGATRTDKEILKMLVDEGVIDTYKVNLQLV